MTPAEQPPPAAAAPSAVTSNAVFWGIWKWVLSLFVFGFVVMLILLIALSAGTSADVPELDGKILAFRGTVTETGRSTVTGEPFATVYVEELRIDVKCYGGATAIGLRPGRRVAVRGVARGFVKRVGGSLQDCQLFR